MLTKNTIIDFAQSLAIVFIQIEYYSNRHVRSHRSLEIDSCEHYSHVIGRKSDYLIPKFISTINLSSIYLGPL